MIINNKIILKKITSEDTANIVRWRNSEAVRKYFIYQQDFTIESHTYWLENVVNAGKAAQFIICEKNGERPVGSVFIKNLNSDEKDGEFGIFIGETDCLGKGYGTESAFKILDYGFFTLGLSCIYLKVLKKNPRAIRCYQRIGFVEIPEKAKLEVINGQEEKVLHMSVLKKDFEASHGK